MKKMLVVGMFLFLLVQLNWGQIKVLQSAGGKSIENSAEKTKIVFELLEEEKKEEVSIYEILSESRVVASGPGGTASGSGQTQRLICYAPAVIELEAGMYRFGLTGNPMLDKKFDVFADGGEQVWGVSTGKPGRAFTGMFMGIMGMTAGTMILIFGLMEAGADSEYEYEDDPSAGGLIAGGLITGGLGGLWFWDGMRNAPKAELLNKSR